MKSRELKVKTSIFIELLQPTPRSIRDSAGVRSSDFKKLIPSHHKKSIIH